MGQQYCLTEEERCALQEALEAYDAQCTDYLGSPEGTSDPSLHELADSHTDLETALYNLKLKPLELAGDNAESAAAAIKNAASALKAKVGKHPAVTHDPAIAQTVLVFVLAISSQAPASILRACEDLVSSIPLA